MPQTGSMALAAALSNARSTLLARLAGVGAQCRDDRAARELAVSRARVDQRLEPALHSPELGDLALDVGEPFLGLALHAAHVTALVRQRQELCDIGE